MILDSVKPMLGTKPPIPPDLWLGFRPWCLSVSNINDIRLRDAVSHGVAFNDVIDMLARFDRWCDVNDTISINGVMPMRIFFTYELIDNPGIYINVTFYTPEADSGSDAFGKTTWVWHSRRVESDPGCEVIYKFASLAMQHEINESFHVNGVQYKNPHDKRHPGNDPLPIDIEL